MDPRLHSYLWAALIAALAVIVSCSNVACTHGPAPAHIALQTTAAVRAPLTAAQVHVARAIAIGKEEQALAKVASAKGIAAGSTEANRLLALVAADNLAKAAAQDQLAAALYRAGELDRAQAAKQAEIDALEKHDAAATARADAEAVKIGKVERSRRFWLVLFLLSLVADICFGEYIERELRWMVKLAWKWIAVGYHFGAGALKSVFPLYAFWLPA